MTRKSLAWIAALLAASGLGGCRNPGAPSQSAPSPPSAVSQPGPAALLVFKDPLTDFSTSDVRDARDHIVQFTAANELVWIDGSRLAGHPVEGPGHRIPGNLPPEASCQCWFVVRFGAIAGQRRAFITADVGHSNPGTLVDLELAGTTLLVRWSDRFPPGTFTLSGVITEATATGLVPLANAQVWRLDEEQSGWDHNTTDQNGFYELRGLSDGSRRATFRKEGYVDIERDLPVHGDTRFDIQLSRR